MPTQAEEQQVAEFLKRAEIRTMRKDLLALRELDAIRERDKIARLKTLDQQLEEKKKVDQSAQAAAFADKMKQVLEKHENEEKIAEKDLKNYATEPEKQQIFLLESQRFGFEKRIDEIDKEEDPKLRLQKNSILIKRQEQEAVLKNISEEEIKLENEQKLIVEKQQTTAIESQKKSLETERWNLDEKLREIEKRRWAAEKILQEIDAEITKIDSKLEKLVVEKNELRNKILGIDKSLREIYTVIIAREEEKRHGIAAEQQAKKEAFAKLKAAKQEEVRREQWSPSFGTKKNVANIKSLENVPKPVRQRLLESFKAEEEERKKFLQDVESWEKNQEEGPTISQNPIQTKKNINFKNGLKNN